MILFLSTRFNCSLTSFTFGGLSAYFKGGASLPLNASVILPFVDALFSSFIYEMLLLLPRLSNEPRTSPLLPRYITGEFVKWLSPDASCLEGELLGK